MFSDTDSFTMSASDQQTPKPTLNFCKSTKDRSKDLHFSLKNIAAHNNMSPTVSECLPVYSPMTDLTMNLCDLSTSWHPGYVNLACENCECVILSFFAGLHLNDKSLSDQDPMSILCKCITYFLLTSSI